MCIYIHIYIYIYTHTHVCMLSCFSRVWLFVTLWIIARQASLLVGFSRWEYWSGLPCSPPGELPDPGIKPMSLTSPVLSGRYFTTSAAWEAHVCISLYIYIWNIFWSIVAFWASLVAQWSRSHLPMQETWVQSLGQEDPLEKEMTTHSSILVCEILWIEEPGGLQSIGLPRVGCRLVTRPPPPPQ